MFVQQRTADLALLPTLPLLEGLHELRLLHGWLRRLLDDRLALVIVRLLSRRQLLVSEQQHEVDLNGRVSRAREELEK